MLIPNISDIIKFKNSSAEAIEFCYERGITGKIVAIENNMFVIDAGLPYLLYANTNDIEVIAKQSEVPILEE